MASCETHNINRFNQIGGSPRKRSILLATLLFCFQALIFSATAAGASESDSGDPYWIENAEFVGSRTLSDGGKAGGASEIYDSIDYQFMLLISSDWDTAFVLDLGTTDVYSYPVNEVISPDGNLLKPEDPGYAVNLFTFNDDGTISFDDDYYDYNIAPAPAILGELTLETLYHRMPVYKRRAVAYSPDPDQIAILQGITKKCDVIAFLGSWCSICKHNVPGVLSTLAAADNPNLTLHIVAMDEDLLTPDEWISKYGIIATPTIIIAENGIELGRFEEEAVPSAEAVLANILAGNK